jgi:hypothetical protein
MLYGDDMMRMIMCGIRYYCSMCIIMTIDPKPKVSQVYYPNARETSFPLIEPLQEPPKTLWFVHTKRTEKFQPLSSLCSSPSYSTSRLSSLYQHSHFCPPIATSRLNNSSRSGMAVNLVSVPLRSVITIPSAISLPKAHPTTSFAFQP